MVEGMSMKDQTSSGRAPALSSRSQFSLFFSTLLYFSNSFSFVQVQLSHVHSSFSKAHKHKEDRINGIWRPTNEGRLGVLDLWGQSKGTVVLGRCGPYSTTTRRRRPKGLSVPTPQQQPSNYWLPTSPQRGPTQ